jgi:hypothetical protein
MNLEYHPKGNFGGELEFFSFISDIMKRWTHVTSILRFVNNRDVYLLYGVTYQTRQDK